MKNTFSKPKQQPSSQDAFERSSDVHIFTTVSTENVSGNQVLSESPQGSIFEMFGVILEELETETGGRNREARHSLWFSGRLSTSQPTVRALPLPAMGAAPQRGHTFLTFLIKTKNVKKVGEQAQSEMVTHHNKSNCQQTNNIPHTHV